MQNELKEDKICAEKITTFGESLAEWNEFRAGPCSCWREDSPVPAASLKFMVCESGGFSAEWQTSDEHYQGATDRTGVNRWTTCITVSVYLSWFLLFNRFLLFWRKSWFLLIYLLFFPDWVGAGIKETEFFHSYQSRRATGIWISNLPPWVSCPGFILHHTALPVKEGKRGAHHCCGATGKVEPNHQVLRTEENGNTAAVCRQ